MSADDVVERFLAAMVAHDWDAMGSCLADDVVRVGPYLDTYRGRDEYVAFISALLPTLPGYAMDVARVVTAGSVVTAQLAETVDDPTGAPLRTPEALVFDLADDGRIARIEVFIQTAPGSP
jgi:ketosteroid isomerase-like protein